MASIAENTRTRLLLATIDLVRANGYAATRVEDVCSAAGVTKGSFFHHFASKEDLAIAAAAEWNERAAKLFASAPYSLHPDPLDRLLGYVKYRRQIIAGEMWEFSCYAGTTIQETHETNPVLREACAESIRKHVEQLEWMIAEALVVYPVAKLRPTTLAQHMQAVIQGAFIMAKTTQERQTAIDCVDHLHRYLELLFASAPKTRAR